MNIKITPAPWDNKKFNVEFTLPEFITRKQVSEKCTELNGIIFIIPKILPWSKEKIFIMQITFPNCENMEKMVDWLTSLEVMWRLTGES